MNKLKKGILLLFAIVYGSALVAQSIDDGKKLFFYEKYQSAKTVFSQLVTANANNVDAVYWLGQSEIALNDSETAKTLYQTTLQANPNSPLLMVGIGHVELLENNGTDARERFETAISLSGGKSAPVLNAIGFANVDAKSGDANYAIDKLKQATAIKGTKDPDIYINLGDAYRKIMDGGSAQGAYENALQLNNMYARASYKIGRIYESQGSMQEDIFMKYYNDAIAKDPTYGPVYYSLYSYFYKRDVNKSKDYLDKYIANSDPDPKDCYYVASILYASSQFQQSIAKSDECIAADGANVYPNLYGLKAYAYDKLGDSANAKIFFDLYFAKQKPENIEHGDYAVYAKNLLKFPNNDSLAGVYIDKAIALDTVESDKISDARIMTDYYTQNKLPAKAGDWYNRMIGFKKMPLLSDYQTTGFNYYRGGNFAAAVGVFDSATDKFPTDMYSYYMKAKALTGIDTSMERGLANGPYQKVVDLGVTDSVKYKAQLIGSYIYFMTYYANIKRDKETALMYCDKALALDPANKDLLSARDQISKINFKQPAKKASSK